MVRVNYSAANFRNKPTVTYLFCDELKEPWSFHINAHCNECSGRCYNVRTNSLVARVFPVSSSIYAEVVILL